MGWRVSERRETPILVLGRVRVQGQVCSPRSLLPGRCPGKCAVCLHSTQPPAPDLPTRHGHCQHCLPRLPVLLCDLGKRNSLSEPQFPPLERGDNPPTQSGGIHGWGCHSYSRSCCQQESTWSVCAAEGGTPLAQARSDARREGPWCRPGLAPARPPAGTDVGGGRPLSARLLSHSFPALPAPRERGEVGGDRGRGGEPGEWAES